MINVPNHQPDKCFIPYRILWIVHICTYIIIGPHIVAIVQASATRPPGPNLRDHPSKTGKNMKKAWKMWEIHGNPQEIEV